MSTISFICICGQRFDSTCLTFHAAENQLHRVGWESKTRSNHHVDRLCQKCAQVEKDKVGNLRFYPIVTLKRFLRRGEITEETFKSLVKREYWPKNLKADKPKERIGT